jgi:2-isopropylmalate synthase
MDQLLVNLKLMGLWEHGLTDLPRYVSLVSEATEVDIPKNYPVFGDDAFRTATGVHAAAIAKAARLGDKTLADTIYSGVPAHLFGLSQCIEIGRMSGKSNVLFWLENQNLPADTSLIEYILSAAHASRKVLTEQELNQLVEEWRASV